MPLAAYACISRKNRVVSMNAHSVNGQDAPVDMRRDPIVITTGCRPSSHSNGYVLVDRDGVLNVAVANGYVTDPSMLHILPGAAVAVAELNRAGYGVIVISNQQCVGKGLLSRDGLRQITERLRDCIRDASGGDIDAFYYCPHLREERCACRKPSPGMIFAAQDRFGFDLAETPFIGDSYTDLETAKAAGTPAIFTLCGLEAERYHAGDPLPVASTPVVADLAEAVGHWLRRR